MPKKPSTTSRPKLAAYQDAQRRTTLYLCTMGTTVLHIPLLAGTPLLVTPAREAAFKVAGWKPTKDYPAEKAAQLFLRYTQDLGAEKDVMDHLAAVVKVGPAQYERAAQILAKVRHPAPTAKRKGAF